MNSTALYSNGNFLYREKEAFDEQFNASWKRLTQSDIAIVMDVLNAKTGSANTLLEYVMGGIQSWKLL